MNQSVLLPGISPSASPEGFLRVAGRMTAKVARDERLRAGPQTFAGQYGTLAAEMDYIGANVRRLFFNGISIMFVTGARGLRKVSLSPAERYLTSIMLTYWVRMLDLSDGPLRKENLYARHDGLSARLAPLVDTIVDWAVQNMPYEEDCPVEIALQRCRIRTMFICQAIDVLARDLIVQYADIEAVMMELDVGEHYSNRISRYVVIEPGGDLPIIEKPVAPVVDNQTQIAELRNSLSEVREALEVSEEDAQEQHERIVAMKARLQDQAALIDQFRREKADYSQADLDAGSEARAADAFVAQSWDDIFLWVLDQFPDQMIILPQAEREARNSEYEDFAEVQRALGLLGDLYARVRKGEGSEADRSRLREQCDLLGYRISPVGRAAQSRRFRNQYYAQYEGKRITLESHLAGSSSRDRTRCLRIYFAWIDNRLVIGHLPTHLMSKETVEL